MGFFSRNKSSAMPDKDALVQAIGSIIDTNHGKSLHESKALSDVDIAGDMIVVHIQLGYPARGYEQALREQVVDTCRKLGADKVEVNIRWEIASHAVQRGLKPYAGIKNIIAVASGKGGVGKSTTAVNLALALKEEGARVGILDADIYGPSVPRMMGLEGAGQPHSPDGKSIQPHVQYGIQTQSIGYLVGEDQPMVWRGPIVSQTLQQLLNDTLWSDLDYLIIDMPPGTGDAQLTLSQKVPVSGAVIVTTPQDIALLDAQRGIRMFEKVNVPILGVVENMAIHICSKCGHAEHIFGEGGGARIAERYHVPHLGSLPLEISIRELADEGQPSVAADPEDRISLMYRDIARKAAALLSLTARDYAAKFPTIVIKKADG